VFWVIEIAVAILQTIIFLYLLIRWVRELDSEWVSRGFHWYVGRDLSRNGYGVWV